LGKFDFAQSLIRKASYQKLKSIIRMLLLLETKKGKIIDTMPATLS